MTPDFSFAIYKNKLKRCLLFFVLSAFAGSFLYCSSTFAQSPGALDAGFGNGGKVLIPVSSGNDYGMSLALQPNGKIILGGYTHNGSNNDLLLMRFNANGTADSTFGTGGQVILPIGTGDDIGSTVALQSDGKILIGGYTHNGTDFDLLLCRFIPGGTLDATFGSGGVVITPVGTGHDYLISGRGIGIQPDGKIIIGGYYSIGGNSYNWTLVRYNANGSLDATFGTGGIVQFSTPAALYSASTGLVLQPDGKIAIGGYYYTGTTTFYDVCIKRFMPDGTYDASFGSGGTVTYVSNVHEYFYDLNIQSDGKLIATGSRGNGMYDETLIIRYTSAGVLDSYITTNINANDDRGASVIIQPDGRIIVAGYANGGPAVPNLYDVSVLRYNTSGSLDGSFGSGGIVTTPVGNAQEFSNMALLQPNGKIVVVGYYFTGSDYNPFLLRYHGCTPITASANAAICQGDSIFLQNAWRKTPGNYLDTLLSQSGCDSIVTTTLTVHPLPPVTFTLNPDTVCITYPPYTLSGASPSGGNYSGPGVSGSLFDPSSAGPGAHYLYYTYSDANGCVNMDSAYVFVDFCTGISLDVTMGTFKMYPNPVVSGSERNVFPGPGDDEILILQETGGKIIYRLAGNKETQKSGFSLSGLNISPGIYFVSLINTGGNLPGKTGKLIVIE